MRIGQTNVIDFVSILNTDGTPKTGLVYNTSGLQCYYVRSDGTASAITLSSMTLPTWVSGGFVEVDSTNMPGLYAVGVPNAALAYGATSCVLYFSGVSGCTFTPKAISLDTTLPQSRVMIVSKAGSDSNSGRPSGPTFNEVTDAKLTIAGALSEMQNGDTLLIMPGTYEETIGVAGKIYTIQGLNAENTIIAPTTGNGFQDYFTGSHCVFNDLTFAPTAGSAAVLYGVPALNHTFNRCRFISSNLYTALDISIQPTIAYRSGVQFNDCYIEGGILGVSITGHTLAEPAMSAWTKFHNCRIVSRSFNTATSSARTVRVGATYPVVFDDCVIINYNDKVGDANSILAGIDTTSVHTITDLPGPTFRNCIITCVGATGYLGRVYGLYGYSGNFINCTFTARNDEDPTRQMDLKVGTANELLNIRLVNSIYRTTDIPFGANLDAQCRSVIQPQPKT